MGTKNSKKLKKEFGRQFKKTRKLSIFLILIAIILLIFGFYYRPFFVLGIFTFIFPYLLVYVKSVDEVCMVKKIHYSKLVEGDLLYKNVKIGKRLIKYNFEGLNREQIGFIKKHKKSVWLREGIPYVPTFLVSFLALGVLFLGNYLDKIWAFF